MSLVGCDKAGIDKRGLQMLEVIRLKRAFYSY